MDSLREPSALNVQHRLLRVIGDQVALSFPESPRGFLVELWYVAWLFLPVREYSIEFCLVIDDIIHLSEVVHANILGHNGKGIPVTVECDSQRRGQL